ncbi:hypothetical protein [Sphingobacterium siyangense]
MTSLPSGARSVPLGQYLAGRFAPDGIDSRTGYPGQFSDKPHDR